MNALDQLIADIEAANPGDLLHLGGPEADVLMSIVTPIFERFTADEGAHVLAILYGCLIGGLEGKPCPEWEQRGMLIGIEERMKLFMATARTVAKGAAAENRSQPNA